MMEMLEFLLKKRLSVIQNVKARFKMSKGDPKCPSASQNFKAWAEKSKREPKHQNASQNMKAPTKMLMLAKPVKHELKCRYES